VGLTGEGGQAEARIGEPAPRDVHQPGRAHGGGPVAGVQQGAEEIDDGWRHEGRCFDGPGVDHRGEKAHLGGEMPAGLFTGIWQAADKIVFSATLRSVSSARTRMERDFDPA
jgi:hypothetical protein